ncbi:hypothetical protein Dda_2588 [Drechslerella dactyloides]|uniref:Uncharacterized protein n=1 Tax=Drechslerella dactyloides TaxID=74499 RepID=A0AAD6NKF4_DREDA|nr:hypothetical protein Dda_2588 [Drechslerella dactyloides]
MSGPQQHEAATRSGFAEKSSKETEQKRWGKKQKNEQKESGGTCGLWCRATTAGFPSCGAQTDLPDDPRPRRAEQETPSQHDMTTMPSAAGLCTLSAHRTAYDDALLA